MSDSAHPERPDPADIVSALDGAVAERLLEINMQLSTVRDPDALLAFIIETAADVIGCEAASVLLFDEATQRLRFAASTGSDPDDLAQIPVPLGGSLAGTVFIENRPLVVGDVSKDARHFERAGRQVAFETRSLVGVPMRLEQKPVGVLESLNKTDGPFTSDDVRVLLIIAAQAAVAIRNARQMRTLEKANAHLKDFNESKSGALSTPLATLLRHADALKEAAPPSLRTPIQRVLDAAQRMRDALDGDSRS